MDKECEKNSCSISKCDIFDFMAKHVGMTVIHPGGMKATSQLSSMLEIQENMNVIDIACGKGSTTMLLAEKYGCHVTGIDISEELIQEARYMAKKKGLTHKVEFLIGDAMNLPFQNNCFDIAISQAMLVLVEDKIKTIQETYRVIKPGGKAGWLELSWKKEIDSAFLDKISNVLCAYCMTKVGTYKEWENIFQKAGINNLKIVKGNNVHGSFLDNLYDEGLFNSIKMFYKIMRNKEIRERINIMNNFFKDYNDYFGLGIYLFDK